MLDKSTSHLNMTIKTPRLYLKLFRYIKILRLVNFYSIISSVSRPKRFPQKTLAALQIHTAESLCFPTKSTAWKQKSNDERYIHAGMRLFTSKDFHYKSSNLGCCICMSSITIDSRGMIQLGKYLIVINIISLLLCIDLPQPGSVKHLSISLQLSVLVFIQF